MNKRKLNKLYEFEDSDVEFKRLELDIASSYIMTFFGDHMKEILTQMKIYVENTIHSNDFEKSIVENLSDFKKTKCVILKYTKQNQKIIQKLFSVGFGYNIKKQFYSYFSILSNAVVGVQYKRNSSNAHWIYIDKNGYVCNSYTNGLQKNGTDQFCQCYAFLMAINPEYRNNFKHIEDSYKFGYIALQKLWKYMLNVVFEFTFNVSPFTNDTIHSQILKIIKNVNKSENQIKVNKIIIKIGNDYISVLTNILNILNSEYALSNAPYFE